MRPTHATILSGLLLGSGLVTAGAIRPAPAAPAGVDAAHAAPSLDLYTGTSVVAEGIRLSAWGSGHAQEDKTKRAAGDSAIKVDTNGFYSGARIEFLKARDVTEQKADPDGFLEFVMDFQPGRPKKDKNQNGPGGMMGGSGSMASMMGRMMGQSGGSSGGRGMPFGGSSGGSSAGRSGGGAGRPFGGSSGGPFGGASGGPYGGGGPGSMASMMGRMMGRGGTGPGAGAEEPPDTHQMKVVLICDEGVYTATNFPVELIPAREEGWSDVAIPWSAFKNAGKSLQDASSVHIREIRVFGDNKDTFWIGTIRTTTDDQPIQVEALDDLEVTVNEPVEFQAKATGGLSPLKYSWDFDVSDSIQEDAVGPSVTHTFKKASPEVPLQPGEYQPYVVTLTVRDLSGAKKPVRRQCNVIVNP